MSQKLLLLIGLVPFSEECLVRLAGATTRVRPRAVAVVVCAVLSLAVLGVAAVAGSAHAPPRRRRRPHLWPAACAVPESDLRAQRQEDDADTEQLHRHDLPGRFREGSEKVQEADAEQQLRRRDLVAELDKGVEDGEQLAHLRTSRHGLSPWPAASLARRGACPAVWMVAKTSGPYVLMV